MHEFSGGGIGTAAIHRGNNYNNALRSFHYKRMEFLEQEIRGLDIETLWLLLHQLCKNGRTLESFSELIV